MKIQSQLILGAAVFGIVLLVIAASMVTTTAEIDRLDQQAQLADRVRLAGSDLNYLANEYLLYGEPRQLERWEQRDAALADDLANLSARTPAQQALVTAIARDRQQLKAVFGEIAAGRPAGAGSPVDPVAMQVAWSRIGVQTQGLAYDASRLSDLLHDEKDRVQSVNTLLTVALLGAFAAALLINYLVVGRRSLRSITDVLAGARVIGSGDLDHAIAVTGDDEVAELSAAFNRMTANLRTVTASRAELEREVVERTKIEEELRQSREWFRVMGEALPYGVWRCNAHGGAEYVSQSFLDLLEMTGEEMREFGWTHRLPPDEVDPMMKRWLHCIETGEDWDDEHHVLGPDGIYHTVLTRGRPVRDRDGEIVAWVGINLDIDDRKRTEEALREYAENLQRSNEDLERYAYVSSHDLQEPLRSIVSFSQLLERRYKGQLGKDADEYIEFVVEGGNRMQALIQDLLAYSRVNSTKQTITQTDITDVLSTVERHLDLQLREAGATIEVGEMPVVMADPLQLEQVFTNLVSNAIKFLEPDRAPEIRISAERLDGFWEFAVADNGIGIEEQYFEQIFVIFQRLHTKDRYPGTGIGLAIVKRIIDRHGGHIRVESTPGEGTTFFFTLPAA